MGRKKLIVNADDFGQSEGINKGIIQSYKNGILTSASLMVRYPSARSAIEYSKKNKIGVGLHIDLGEWIYDDGNWNALYEVVDMENINEVTDEINRQIESFYQLAGRKPTHIDSHQHVHQQEKIKPILLDIAQRLNVNLRDSRPNVKYCGNFYGQLSDSSAYHQAISSENLKEIISSLTDGITELACHPGLDVEIQTMYKIEREIEVKSLCDESVRDTIIREDIELCSFEGITF